MSTMKPVKVPMPNRFSAKSGHLFISAHHATSPTALRTTMYRRVCALVQMGEGYEAFPHPDFYARSCRGAFSEGATPPTAG